MAKPKTSPVVSGIRQRRKKFAAAHDKGMRALRAHDYDALEEAILEERKIIEEQAMLVQAAGMPKAKRKPAKKAKR